MINETGVEYIDDLTGLYNRRYMNRTAFEYIHETGQKKAILSIVIIDLDHFKNINDTYGHSVGDDVLVEYAAFLKDLLRKEDTVYRYGGDEFVCILPETRYKQAVRIASRILEQSNSREFSKIRMTCSIGIASFPVDGQDWLSVFNAADRRLYSAKRHGRNRIGAFRKEYRKVISPTKRIIGRDKEIAGIISSIDQKGSDRSKTTCISGEIGVGKTRLVHEIVNDSRYRDFTCLTSNLSATTKSIPYYPFREIIRSVFRKKGMGIIDGIPQAFQIELIKIVPELSDELVEMNESMFMLDKFRLYEGVRRFLEIQVLESSLFVCIDNIHWADDNSLELLNYLVRALKESPVFFFFIYRVEEAKAESFQNVIQSISREGLYDPLEIEPLENADVARMLSLMVDVSPSPELTDYIYMETGGNPFFIEELMKSLEENEAFIWDKEELSFDRNRKIVIPLSVSGVVDRKLGMMSRQARELLEYAAVTGREFDFAFLRDLTVMNEGQLFDLLDEILNMRLLKESNGERFCFSEDVIRETIYQKINKVRLSRYHGTIGEKLLSINKDNIEEVVEELSHHFYLCGNKEEAIKYSIQAADRARDSYANQDAIGYYSRALECLKDTSIEDRYLKEIECLEKRADVLKCIGDTERAIEDLEEAIRKARETGNRIKEAECLLAFCEVCQNRAKYTETEQKADMALDIYRELNDEKGEASCLTQIGRSYWSRSEYSQALEFFQKSLKIQEGIKDRRGEAVNFNSIGIVYGETGEFAKALDYFQRSSDIKDEAGDSLGVAASLNNIGIVYDHIGDHSEAMDFYQRALEIIEEIGDLRGEAITLNNIGIGSLCLGEDSKALRSFERSLKISEAIGDRRGEAASLINIGIIYDHLGELSRAMETYRRSIMIQRKIGDREGEAASLLSIADIFTQQGEYSDGEEYFERAHEIAQEIKSKMLLAYINLGFTILRLEKGDLAGAEESLKQSISLKDELASKEIDALVYCASGRISVKLKKWKEAESSFRKSITVYESIGNRFNLGQIYYHLGLMFNESAEQDRADKSFDESQKIFEKLGSQIWIEKIRAERKPKNT